MANLKKFLPHLLVLVGFVIVSLFYFSPVLEGKKIFQSDIVQYIGMAKEQNDFRDQTGGTGEECVEADRVVQASSAVGRRRQFLAAPMALERRALRDLVLDQHRPVSGDHGFLKRW